MAKISTCSLSIDLFTLVSLGFNVVWQLDSSSECPQERMRKCVTCLCCSFGSCIVTVSSYSFGQDSHKVLHRFKAAGGGHRPQYLMGKMSKLHCKKSMWSRRGFMVLLSLLCSFSGKQYHENNMGGEIFLARKKILSISPFITPVILLYYAKQFSGE